MFARDERTLDRSGEAARPGARSPQRAVDGVGEVGIGEDEHRVGPGGTGGEVHDARAAARGAQAHQPLGNPGARDDARDPLGRRGRIGRRGEDRAVAGQERGADDGERLRERRARRAADADHAHRRVAGARARQRVKRAGKGEAVGAEKPLGVCAKPIEDVNGGQQLERGDLGAGAPGLGGEREAEVVELVGHGLRDALHVAGAVGDAQLRPQPRDRRHVVERRAHGVRPRAARTRARASAQRPSESPGE